MLMVLSDMSLLAAANDLVDRCRARDVGEVLPPLTVAEKKLPRWLRSAFAFIYTRATVVVTPLYLLYHLLLVPDLHMAALTLFAMSDERQAPVQVRRCEDHVHHPVPHRRAGCPRGLDPPAATLAHVHGRSSSTEIGRAHV